MELKITKETNDKYFDRKVIEFHIKKENKEIVKLEDVKGKLRERFPEGTLIVYTLKNVYGMNAANGVAHLYKDEAVAKKVLQPFILRKNGVLNGKEKE